MKRYKIKDSKWEQFTTEYKELGFNFDNSTGFECYNADGLIVLKISHYCFAIDGGYHTHTKVLQRMKRQGYLQQVNVRDIFI